MQSDFETKALTRAKKILEKDLSMAEHIHKAELEKQRRKLEKMSLWGKVKSFFSDLF
jgi:RNA polymerase-interacting CarD/CdnL/TRCF family regulator